MQKNIFLTGGVGFLGSYLTKELLRDKDNILYLLVRDKKGMPAVKRVDSVFKPLLKQDFKNLRNRIKIIEGDITYKGLGIKAADRKGIIKNIDVIYHSAALCNLIEPLKVMRPVNVEGTKNVLDFALECLNKGRIKEVHHISTVAVAGNSKGNFYENMLDIGQGFNNPYEQSKFEAEKLVEEYRKRGLEISIYRPSIIVGNFSTGETNNFDIFYRFLEILSLEIFDVIPVNGKSCLNMVPVDKAAKAVYLISKNREEKNRTYHIINSKDIRLGFMIKTASEYFGFKKPAMAPSLNKKLGLTKFQERLLNAYLPYGNYRVRFDSANTKKALNNNGFFWPKPDKKNLEILYRYCERVNYIRKR